MGVGVTSTISGASVTYARGGDAANVITPPTPNTGNGGNGTTGSALPPNGANGVVIISYPGAQAFLGGVITSVGGNTIHTFNQAGSLAPLNYIGRDYSGNNNNWDTFAFNDDSTSWDYDRMTDIPSLTSENQANYCVWNPLSSSAPFAITDGNLSIPNTNNKAANGTFGVSSGKWYWEIQSIGTPAGYMGVTSYPYENDPDVAPTLNSANPRSVIGSSSYLGSMGLYKSYTGSSFAGLPTPITNATGVYGFALDLTGGTLQYYKDGSLIFTDTTIPSNSTTLFPYLGHTNAGAGNTWATAKVNFGQQPFKFAPPTGYLELNTYNLPEPSIMKPNTHMNAVAYSGTGTLGRAVNGFGFMPDFAWIKQRSGTEDHKLTDSVRGVTKQLSSNNVNQEYNNTDQITAFTSDGFTTDNSGSTNGNSQTYIAWAWRASNTTAVANTAGTITSQVSANTTSGFSILTYTGTGANATVGHGLGITPSMVIVKQRNIIQSWCIWHSGIALSEVLFLNSNAAKTSYPTLFNSMATLNATVFSVGTDVGTNQSSGTYVAYCFAQIAGYSAFGSYTGNGSTDGPFVFTGFRPRYVMIKASSTGGAGYDWFIHDSARDTYNTCTLDLEANLSLSENQYGAEQDFLSNGFKLRNTGGGTNQNGVTYVYCAFAENPFKYALGR